MNVHLYHLFLAAVLLLVGCEAAELPDEEPSTPPVQGTTATLVADVAPKAEPEKKAEPPARAESAATSATADANDSSESDSSTSEPAGGEASPAPDTVSSREKAAAGAGKKGQGYGGGPISEPARQYFRIRERAVFDIQIPQALKMFNAINGKGPADHEEFMKKIVGENNISLPELPAGKKYVFDTEKGELMIERIQE